MNPYSLDTRCSKCSELEKEIKRLNEVLLLQQENTKLKEDNERLTPKQRRNKGRRRRYAKIQKLKTEGMIELPSEKILFFRDKRLRAKNSYFAKIGFEFAVQKRLPEDYIAWLVYSWNAETYTKKPITFSGSSYMIWQGSHRQGIGLRDLMHFSATTNKIYPVATNVDAHDFRNRMWWEFCNTVFVPIYRIMLTLGVDTVATPRFLKFMQVYAGSYSELEVSTDVFWDFSESDKRLQFMLRPTKVGSTLTKLLRATVRGLRSKQPPVDIDNINQPPQSSPQPSHQQHHQV